MKVLLAEDDGKLGKMLCRLFAGEKIHVDCVENGEDALAYVGAVEYDVIILDWMMPRLSGIEVCRQLRQQGVSCGILMLTAKDTTEDTVFGLDTGADDYIIKPVVFDELLARVRAVYRRGHNKIRENKVSRGSLTIDINSYKVMRGSEEIKLTQKEFQLLELFMVNAGKTIPRDVIFERLWGNEGSVMSNTLDVYVKLLRDKIDKKGAPSLIRTVRGIGYRME